MAKKIGEAGGKAEATPWFVDVARYAALRYRSPDPSASTSETEYLTPERRPTGRGDAVAGESSTHTVIRSQASYASSASTRTSVQAGPVRTELFIPHLAKLSQTPRDSAYAWPRVLQLITAGDGPFAIGLCDASMGQSR